MRHTMTAEEYLETLRWVNDQYRMAIELKEGYMAGMRRIPERVSAGELTSEEGERLIREYEDVNEAMDRHMADVREIEAELNRIRDIHEMVRQKQVHEAGILEDCLDAHHNEIPAYAAADRSRCKDNKDKLR